MLTHLALTTLLLGAEPTPGGVPEVRHAIEKALPFIEKEGLAWRTERKCLSCHNGTFMLWSHYEARARGIAVDEKKLAEWTDWSIRFSQSQRNWFKFTDATWKGLAAEGLSADVTAKLQPLKGRGFETPTALTADLKTRLSPEELARHEGIVVRHTAQPPKGAENDGGGLDTMTQLLLFQYPSDGAFATGLAANLLRFQEPNGSWKAAGQLPRQKRPGLESNAATTMWTVLALSNLEETPDLLRSRQRALVWLKTAPLGDTTESVLLRMLIEHKFGDAAKTQELLKALRARQHADGGWSWAKDKPSDAYATGQSLYALGLMGVADDDPAIRNAWKFLIETQQPDGSWLTPSSAISSTPAKGRDAIYHFWGSTWAAIGLARSLPPQGK